MSTPTPSPASAEPHPDETPHFEECLCPIHPGISILPLHSRVPTPSDPLLPGPCIYHQRLSTRDAETAIFIQLAPEIDELKEVLSTGMVKFRPGGHSGGGAIVLKKATTEELGEAVGALRVLIQERERLVRECWGRFVERWGGRCERRDDGTMFVVDAGKVLEEEQKGDEGEEGGEGKAKARMEQQVEDDEADPYVRRMREVQARMDDLKVMDERVKAKRAKAGKAAEEYAKGDGSGSGSS